ncbi:M42 family peptidase [Sulfitobacter mediterraneus]|uniref:M42 family metallopeptidase n=1 Tax=Sulfitobacter mediterraneus TaxID=83219 RepID=UPI001934415D|nr:M42 family peptidase [Sulfitobacter mediterraneus]MBM1635183.1 M42 family peptidase [Sulfitobacter mediterraneus]MBM1643034.1 M42 family peptidase [Sulfitobacter mediterraneus]MBM1647082.1 M42 family peptidase [Sulfitobacter mediterraneus]MBM1651124.1 M42 family peptidase [Sulfitobacter mediterraneus]MBM1655149.1 M42 family peptidase [Sulfitobacter mediterraneus]
MNLGLLKSLCETHGVPGREHRVRALIERETQGLFDTVETDSMGSLLCCRQADAPDAPRIMLLSHMDEIGFLVSHICENGFVYVQPVGSFDPRHLFSCRVIVCTEAGDLPGVMTAGVKPVHISTDEERKNIPPLEDFYIDTGLGQKARDVIQIGDFVVMEGPFVQMGDKIVSKALDNRIACWLAIEAMRRIGEGGRGAEIHVAFTCQEEVGMRGARTAAHAVRPDIGLGIDVTLACDTPGTPPHMAHCKLGQGFGLLVRDGSFIADRELVSDIGSLAQAHQIAMQRTMQLAGGQDASAAQQAAAGARAVGITVGTRYIHTAGEMAATIDLVAALDVVVAYLESFSV